MPASQNYKPAVYRKTEKNVKTIVQKKTNLSAIFYFFYFCNTPGVLVFKKNKRHFCYPENNSRKLLF
jgi:hypothetical protein